MKKELILNLIEILLLFVFVILPVRFFLFEPFLVRGESMEPNFHNFDYLIIDKFSYRFTEPKRGDVVVFRPPFDSKVYYIKRVIGLPGERILIENSKITIFNQEHPEGLVLKEDYLKNHYTFGKVDLTLGPDEYFLLGDNREASYDSRKWGPLKRKNIVGKVVLQISLVKLTHALQK